MSHALSAYESLLPVLADKLTLLVRQCRWHTPVLSRADLLQEGWLAIVRAASTYDPTRGACFVTYAAACAQGAMHDAVARHDTVRRPSPRTRPVLARRAWERELLRQTAPDPAVLYAARDARRQVAQAVTRLAPKKRQAVEQRFWQDLPATTIAAQDGVLPMAVWQRLWQAKHQLQKEFADAALSDAHYA